MDDIKRRGEIAGIQILRAFAAVIVVIHHALEESRGAKGTFSPDWVATSGAAGVDIFFVISGFIMMYTSFSGTARAPSPAAFLWKRALRIYPLYWMCCAAILIAVAVGYLKNLHLDLGDIITSLLLLPGNHLILGVSWTLVYEVYFYVIFAATLVLNSRSASAILTPLLMLVTFLISLLLPDGKTRIFLHDPIVIEFCMGLWLGWAASRYELKLPAWVAAAALLAAFIAPIFIPHPTTAGLPPIPRVVFWGIPAVAIVAFSLRIRTVRGAFGRFLLLAGGASYALYLTHPILMIAYAALIKRSASFSALPQFPVLCVIVAAAVAASIQVHLKVEKPLASSIRALGRHRTVPASRVR